MYIYNSRKRSCDKCVVRALNRENSRIGRYEVREKTAEPIERKSGTGSPSLEKRQERGRDKGKPDRAAGNRTEIAHTAQKNENRYRLERANTSRLTSFSSVSR